jgi:hypothetical protein
MSSTVRATLERYTPTEHGTKPLPATLELVQEEIKKIENDWSTTIELASDETQVLITASRGGYAVFASVGEDQFFDLVGDPSSRGNAEFVQGGQPAEHPRRHIVPKSLALKAAAAFFKQPTDPLRLGGLQWEKQEDWQRLE